MDDAVDRATRCERDIDGERRRCRAAEAALAGAYTRSLLSST